MFDHLRRVSRYSNATNRVIRKTLHFRDKKYTKKEILDLEILFAHKQ